LAILYQESNTMRYHDYDLYTALPGERCLQMKLVKATIIDIFMLGAFYIRKYIEGEEIRTIIKEPSNQFLILENKILSHESVIHNLKFSKSPFAIII